MITVVYGGKYEKVVNCPDSSCGGEIILNYDTKTGTDASTVCDNCNMGVLIRLADDSEEFDGRDATYEVLYSLVIDPE